MLPPVYVLGAPDRYWKDWYMSSIIAKRKKYKTLCKI